MKPKAEPNQQEKANPNIQKREHASKE